jgi:hypothetical protein
MSDQQIAFLVSRLAVEAAATFLAIILWSKTRDPAWMLIVIGTVASYADILFSTLEIAGVADPGMGSVAGIPLARIAFGNLPSLFYIAGFAVLIARKRGG